MKTLNPEPYTLYPARRPDAGFSMLEVLITTAILLVVMTIALVSWFGYAQRTAVDVATRGILNMLHEAQGNSVARIKNSSWGVYVSNPVGTMNAPYAELFYGVSYATGTVTRRAEFSNSMEFSTPPDGASSEIVFMQRSGRTASTDGELWIAYQDQTSDNLKVARYIPGSTGTGCINGASGWNCEVLATGGMTTNIATQDINIGPSSEVWISFNRDQGSGDFSLWAAKYVGVNGNCDTVLQGSDAWECAQVHVPPGGQDILDNEIVVAPNGTVWIVYDLNNNVYVANRTGTGSESTCLGGSADWNCALLRSHEVSNVSIAIDNAGNPWVVHDGDVNSDLTVLTYVGVNGNCAVNDKWDCELNIVQDGDAGGDITDPTIAFSSSDMAWVAFGVGTVNELHVARRTGTAMETSCGMTGDANWDCTTIDSTRTVDGRKNGLAFNPAGAPWISYRDGGATDDLWVARRVADTSGGGTTTLDRQITVGADDGHLVDLPLFNSGGNPGVGTASGMGDPFIVAWYRFPNITIPQGTTITTAYITQTRVSSAAGNVNALIAGINEDNHVAPIGEATWMAHHSSHTMASVPWSFTQADSGSQNTPEIKDIIEEVIARGSWTSGNAIGIHIDDNGTATGTWQTWDDVEGANGATLHIEYTDAGASCDDTNWTCEKVEVTDLVAWGSDFVFDSLGTAQIIYRNKTGDDALRLARYTGSESEASCGGGSLNWICEDIDNPGALVDVGADPRIAAGPVWRVHMYALADTNLRTKTITVSAFGGIIITDG